MALSPIDQKAFDVLASKFPARYRVKGTAYLKALLEALATGDGYIDTQIEAVRDNLLVVTATGKHLDRRASQYGVVRGTGTGVQDDDFRKLIPVLGMSPKQITHSLQRIIDAIYGPYASHANISASAPGPYTLSDGSRLLILVDGTELEVYFRPEDAVSITAASAEEVATAITNRTNGKVIGSVITNTRTGDSFVNLRTATIGSQGFIQILGGDAQSAMRFPEIRPTRQTLGTWTVTRYQGSDEMVYTETDPAQTPSIRTSGVRTGDRVTVRSDSGLNSGNCGSFEITFVDESSFRCSNGDGVPEAGISNHHVDDFVFYRANLGNVLLAARPATILQTGDKELTVLLPVTSPIVKRTLRGGHHFHGGLSVLTGATSNSATLGSTSGFSSTGSIHVVTSRKSSEGTCSTIEPSTIVLVSSEGWPTSGAVYSSVTQTFYYYNGLSGSSLTGVTPQPPSSLAGSPLKYSDRFLYTGIAGNILTGVYPDPTATIGLEVTSQVELIPGFVGSFIFDPTAPFMAASESTRFTETVQQGSSRTVVGVGDVTNWPAKGYFVSEPSTKEQEGPIKYFTKVGSHALIIDPGHVFKRDHLTGTVIRLVRAENIGPYKPRTTGEDYAVYLTGTSQARTLLAQYLQDIVAAGITLIFNIQVPDQKWPVSTQLYAAGPTDTTLT